MKVKLNDVHIAFCAVHHDSAAIGIRVADMQVACAHVCLVDYLPNLLPLMFYSVLMSYAIDLVQDVYHRLTFNSAYAEKTQNCVCWPSVHVQHRYTDIHFVWFRS